MKYQASRKVNGVKWLTVLLYIIGIGVFVLPSYVKMSYGAVCQLAGVGALAIAIQFTNRYMLTSYTYEIYDYASAASLYPVLNVYRVQGQRSTLIAGAGFVDMISIEKKDKIVDGVTKAANYCPEFRAKNVYRILFEDGKKEKAIYLQCDDKFAAALAERIALYGKNRQIISESDN